MSKSDGELKKLAHALKVSGLEVLHMSNCCMMDFEVRILADSLQSNTMLKILILYNYHYRESVLYPNIISVGEAYVLAECLGQNSTLLTLTLPVGLRSEIEFMQEEINHFRREKGLPCIELNMESKFKIMVRLLTLGTHAPRVRVRVTVITFHAYIRLSPAAT